MALKTNLLFVLLSLVCVQAHGALPQYRAEEILAPRDTLFWGLNSAGIIVGRAPNVTTGVDGIIRRPDGTVSLVPPPPGYEGYQVNFTDINEAGQISGTLVHAFNGTGKGFVYTEASGFRIMNSAPNEAIGTTSMTDDGLMAFTFSGGSGLWNPLTNGFTHIPQPGLSAAVAGGLATGDNWSWNNGEFRQLLGGGVILSNSIESSGFIAGNRLIAGRSAASIWNPDGTLNFSDVSSTYTSIFSGIALGRIAVGNRRFSDGRVIGTYYSPSSGVVDVNSLVVEQNFAGSIHSMYAIEANGLAVGRRLVGEEISHVFLTPVPEPGTILALGAGLAALLRPRREVV